MLEIFLQGIREKRLLSVDFVAKEDNLLRNRTCVPFDYGPSRKFRDQNDRFHFLDLDSPVGSHTLSILPSQIYKIELKDETFDPCKYVTWAPSWHISRDWGLCS